VGFVHHYNHVVDVILCDTSNTCITCWIFGYLS